MNDYLIPVLKKSVGQIFNQSIPTIHKPAITNLLLAFLFVSIRSRKSVESPVKQ